MTHQYHINLFWSRADECWIADVPDLVGCSARGETPAEAVEEAEVAIGLWIDAAKDHGDPIPEACYRPAIYATKAT